jgi:hypothetical protein
MDQAGQEHPGAGVPPWLLITLVMLVVGLSQIVGELRTDFADYRQNEETQRAQLVVTQIPDGLSLFPVILPDNLPKEASLAEQKVWLEKAGQMAEQRDARVHEWLMDGACERFRTSVNRALTEITRARDLTDDYKATLLGLVELKTQSMNYFLRALNNDHLRELIRQEGWQPAPTATQTEMISYLLDTNEAQRGKPRSDWQKFPQNTPPTLKRLNLDAGSVEVWAMVAQSALIKLAFLLDLGILLIPVAGLLTAILPRWRALKVEKKFGLQQAGEEIAELNEIRALLATTAPFVELRVNLLHPGFAFVYPRGYRRPCIAILTGMYVLWRRDPEAARGIVRHELEHVRRGDYLIVGYGSFFSHYLTWLLACFFVLMLMMLVIALVSSVAVVGLDPQHQARLFVTSAMMIMASSASIFFLMMSHIIVPLAGVWALELNADYAASRGGLLQLECSTKSMRRTWASRFLGSLTHPPLWLRAWLTAQDDWRRSLCRQMVFPSSYLLKIAILFLFGFLATVSTKGLNAELIEWLLSLSWGAFVSRYWVFGGIAVVLLLWPWIAIYWERLFAGEGRKYAWWDGGSWAAAMLMTMMAVVAYLGSQRSP